MYRTAFIVLLTVLGIESGSLQAEVRLNDFLVPTPKLDSLFSNPGVNFNLTSGSSANIKRLMIQFFGANDCTSTLGAEYVTNSNSVFFVAQPSTAFTMNKYSIYKKAVDDEGLSAVAILSMSIRFRSGASLAGGNAAVFNTGTFPTNCGSSGLGSGYCCVAITCTVGTASCEQISTPDNDFTLVN